MLPAISSTSITKPVQHTILALTAALLLTGCPANPTNDLTKVAKDWSLTIRASQVIPVYPLSEDVVPGDVFLVQTPISEQAKVYEDSGFLALDQLVTRLATQEVSKDFFNYENFYGNGYFAGTYSTQTGPHPRPGIGSETAVIAPRAAFPAYSFSINQSTGFNLALPLSGVPIALGLMNTSSATGTVTLGDAYTYGIDTESVARALYTWWKSNQNEGAKRRENFKQISKNSNQELYLRVVTRVFITRSLDVTITNTESTAAGAQFSNPIQLTATTPTPATPPANSSTTTPAPLTLSTPVNGTDSASNAFTAYTNSLNALNSSLIPSATPNGNLQFVNGTSRSVSMKQTFERPLVIGYQGFDVKIFADGNLSTLIPSFGVLNGKIKDGNTSFHPVGIKNDLTPILNNLRARPEVQRKQIAGKVATAIGGQFKTQYLSYLDSGKNNAYEAFKQAKDDYLDTGAESLQPLIRQQIQDQLENALMAVPTN